MATSLSNTVWSRHKVVLLAQIQKNNLSSRYLIADTQNDLFLLNFSLLDRSSLIGWMDSFAGRGYSGWILGFYTGKGWATLLGLLFLYLNTLLTWPLLAWDQRMGRCDGIPGLNTRLGFDTPLGWRQSVPVGRTRVNHRRNVSL